MFAKGSESLLTVQVEDDVGDQVVSIKSKFAVTITECFSIMEEEQVSFEKLRLYSFAFGDIDASEVKKVTSIEELLLFLDGRSYSYIDPRALRIITQGFSQKAHALVLTYAEELELFVSNIKVYQFMQALMAIPEELVKDGLQPVTLKLQSKWMTVTVNALLTLIQHFFPTCKPPVINPKLGPGCVCFRWYLVTSAIEKLTQEAQEKTVIMKDEGVLALTVGSELIMKNEEALKEVQCNVFSF